MLQNQLNQFVYEGRCPRWLLPLLPPAIYSSRAIL